MGEEGSVFSQNKSGVVLMGYIGTLNRSREGVGGRGDLFLSKQILSCTDGIPQNF